MFYKERKQAAIFVTAGLLAVWFIFFRYLPLRKKMAALEQAKVAREAEFATVLSQSRNLPALRIQLEQLVKKVGNYDAKIPARRDIGAFLQNIATLMDRYDLTEQLIEPGQEVEVDTLKCIPVNMRGKGSLEKIFEFFDALKALERLVRIESVTLSNDKEFSGRVSMQTRAVIYYRKPDAQKAGEG